MSMTAEEWFGRTRSLLADVVKYERRACGSTMKAYRRIAPKIGASVHWIRRVLGRHDRTVVQVHQYANVYVEWCKRIEAKADLMQRQTLEIEEKTNAIVESRAFGVPLVLPPVDRP